MATLKNTKNFFKTNYRLMQVKSIAESILQYIRPSLSYHLSIFEWPFYTVFTVLAHEPVCNKTNTLVLHPDQDGQPYTLICAFTGSMKKVCALIATGGVYSKGSDQTVKMPSLI